MERNEGAAKVGAGGTAFCEGCGLPLAQALGEAGACQCPGGLRKPSEFSETSVWLFEFWDKARKRDQAALARLHARSEAIVTEGVAKILQAALEQRAEQLRPLCQSIRQKAIDLQRLRPDSPVEQELLADLDELLAAIDRKP